MHTTGRNDHDTERFSELTPEEAAVINGGGFLGAVIGGIVGGGLGFLGGGGFGAGFGAQFGMILGSALQDRFF